MIKESILFESAQVANATVTQDLNTQAASHQLVLNSGTATAGTATITAKSVGGTFYESIYDSFGAALTHTFTASSSKTFNISAGDEWLGSSIKIVTSGMDGTFTVSLLALSQ